MDKREELTKEDILAMQVIAEMAYQTKPSFFTKEACVLMYEKTGAQVVHVKTSFNHAKKEARRLFSKKKIASVIFSFNELPYIKHTIVGTNKG